ncbi:MAG: SigB/SigF/SigG family RNA polymerase sigma factor [Lachnospiraceae bacterium]|nr:SigB/SigF/SigG family RNA polymerase sigma factor [Lachnospiraceae bacterium]MBO5145497.1 SigB/SigF/SigG family RNA polymerase sigma factor [Lachnospiraceae bacterium]
MEEKELFIRAQRGEREAKEELFDKNRGLVHHVMKRFIGRSGIEAEDLFQIGSLGLLKAIEKFDTDYGVCFSTYAVPLIMGEIRRFLRDDGIIKISRSIKENSRQLKQIREFLQQKTGREPTLSELAQESGLAVEDIVTALEAGREVESIDKTIYESDGSEVRLLDMLGKEGESEEIVNKLLLEKLLDGLDEREKNLIRLRYFENKTQIQVAGDLGMSQVQVSRMEKRVLLRLRQEAMA